VRELSFFLRAIINGGEFNNVRILKESTLKMMLKEQIKEDKSQGLCWENIGFKSLWGHLEELTEFFQRRFEQTGSSSH
jgi:hypothetical protein